jgi:hypothetical protein
MTLAIVDPLGQYNTDNSTSWVANDAGAKCVYLPSAGEFWVLLETGTGPTASGSHSTNSHFLRVDETTGDYIAMADDPAGQAGKLFLWGPLVADDVNSLVISAGTYVTTSGGTTIGGNCMIAWNYDGTVAWENFWGTESDGSPFTFGYLHHIIYHPSLGALYVVQDGTLHNRFMSLNLATGARTTTGITYRDIPGNYPPVMDDAGDVWVTVDAVHLGAGLRVMRYSLSGTPTSTVIEQWAIGSGIAPGRFVYDRWSDYAWWNLAGSSPGPAMRRWDGAAVVSQSNSNTWWGANGSSASVIPDQFSSRTGYFAFTISNSSSLPNKRDAYFLDLSTFDTSKKVTEPADTYSTEYAASGLKWQFSTSINRAWWRIKQTTWKFLVWTDATTRRRVSVCVIT